MPMRMPRVRFTVRRLMVAVAFLAILSFAVVMMMRPYPWFVRPGGLTYWVEWSDGSMTSYSGENNLPWSEIRRYGPFLLIRWKDGSYSLRLVTSKPPIGL